MNNYEKIKNMTLEETANFIEGIYSNFEEPPCFYCGFYDEICSPDDEDFNCDKDCNDGIKEWLEAEAE